MRTPRGFTLMEMLTTLGLVAILSTLAAPTFSDLRLNSSRTVAVNGFFHALFLARSEAIKRGTVVSLCKSRDRQRCVAGASAQWTDGYVVFVNTDRDDPAQIDRGEEVLQIVEPWSTGRITANRESFSFRPYTQGVVNGTVVFCDVRGADQARAIIISHTGRPRISQRDASNRRLACPS
ncbi:MAG: GspH/FimT family pseudopilin [Steroidobacteraceae bacterium]